MTEDAKTTLAAMLGIEPEDIDRIGLALMDAVVLAEKRHGETPGGIKWREV